MSQKEIITLRFLRQQFERLSTLEQQKEFVEKHIFDIEKLCTTSLIGKREDFLWLDTANKLLPPQNNSSREFPF